ncbi:HpcH/HpaI aldolase/citrate lyase family protein [Akkermansiaceae bacterium]|nr:HpcH/HpaI aldolase/citrate lyase family protein [Akkermansiaceae bacterium]
MKHNQYASNFSFVEEPVEFNKFMEKSRLQYYLGATLYMPGTKDITDKVLARSFDGLTSMVMCFEDAIDEASVGEAEGNVFRHLDDLSVAIKEGRISHDDIPLTFLRVRNTEQFIRFSNQLTREQREVLTGFVFPKFYSQNAHDYLEQLVRVNETLSITLYGMPILEGNEIAHLETRREELQKLRDVLAKYQKLILNVRVGGTDFSSIFGVRRGINSSIYDIMTVRDCLSDILNFFNRETDDFTVSAPVWEYFRAYKKDDLKALLSENIHRSLTNREPILNDAIDGLLREVLMDKANGFVGKTIIHPSHLRFVNAMQAVTREEFEDAQQILGGGSGVIKSNRDNKMNEMNPHRNWARKVIRRSEAFGVIEDEAEYLKLCLQ